NTRGAAFGSQTAGTSFTVEVTVQAQYNNTVTGFSGTVDLSSNRTCSAGCNQSAAFSAGVLASKAVTLTQAGAGATITATNPDGSAPGTSSPRTVSPAALDHFAVTNPSSGTIGRQTAGTSFHVELPAQPTRRSTDLGFSGTVDLSSNRTCSAGCNTSAAFSAGVLASKAVTLTQAAAGATITATKTAGSETGTSNNFTSNHG